MDVSREETEIIEGEVVELQIDRPATGTVCLVVGSVVVVIMMTLLALVSVIGV